jgi:uncharacterized membrane protein YdjX (TVP38/TMEM64 family)
MVTVLDDNDNLEIDEAGNEKKPMSYWVTRGIATVALVFFVVMIAIYWDEVKDGMSNLIIWMGSHPAAGPFILAGIFAVLTILFVPCTAPILCCGSGCAFTQAYGSVWWGLLIGVSSCFAGAFLGSLGAFFIGRYIFKE